MRLSRAERTSLEAEWRAWAVAITDSARAGLVAAAAVGCLEVGLTPAVVAAVLRARFSAAEADDWTLIAAEEGYSTRALADVRDQARIGLIDQRAARALESEHRSRLTWLGTAREAFGSAELVPTAIAEAALTRSVPAFISDAAAPTSIAPAVPKPEPGPGPSLAELLQTHSILILASMGAFLLVVATVLFELYGGQTWGFVGVVALTAVFGGLGFGALGVDRLRTVGHIYLALAAVMLPLVGLAAWTFLHLGDHGLTVDQAVGITGLTCAVAYGTMAISLGLRPYGTMAGTALLVGGFAAARATLGDGWAPVAVAMIPLVCGGVSRLARGTELRDLAWIGHASAALGVMLAWAEWPSPSRWIGPVAMAAAGAAYLGWRAMAADRWLAWIGQVALMLALATAIPIKWGLGGWGPMALMAIALLYLALARRPAWFGSVGATYASHIGLFHVTVASGLVLSVQSLEASWQWSEAAALWVAFGLYVLDLVLTPTSVTAVLLRIALPLALVSTGEASGLGTWTAALVSLAAVGYLALPRVRLGGDLLVRGGRWFFYGALMLSAFELPGATLGKGHWEIAAAAAAWAVALGAASELGEVAWSALIARALLSVAWFMGIEALGAADWRGPLDAIIPLVYVAMGEVRRAVRDPLTTARRVELIHLSGAVAVGLCLVGSEPGLSLRLGIAFALLALAYWWLALDPLHREQAAAAQPETRWLAWLALAASAGALVLAWVREDWQGPAMVACAAGPTILWAEVRRVADPYRRLDLAGISMLGLLGLAGLSLAFLREGLPSWPQSLALLVASLFLILWWALYRDQENERQQGLRAASALAASTAVILGAGVLKLDAGSLGAVLVLLALAHGVGAVLTTGRVERGYAWLALLGAVAVLELWWQPAADVGLVALELVILALVWVPVAILSRIPVALLPTVPVLAVAADPALRAIGLGGQSRPEHLAWAALAVAGAVTGITVRAQWGRKWAAPAEVSAAIVGVVAVLAALVGGETDLAAIALVAFAPLAYVVGAQDEGAPHVALAAALGAVGVCLLLNTRSADVLLYPVAMGVLGLVFWLGGVSSARTLDPAHPYVRMHRHLGLSVLLAAALASFGFPAETAMGTRGGFLAAAGLLIAAGVLWMDATYYSRPQNEYVAIVVASLSGWFLTGEAGLDQWHAFLPGLGAVAAGIRARGEGRFNFHRQWRQILVACGLAVAFGPALVRAGEGDTWWVVVLLFEGAVAIGAGIVLRSRVLLLGGSAAIAFTSLRALLTVAQAGYLFVAFGVVAIVLLGGATFLALGRERYAGGMREMRTALDAWE